jgi:hypothetical protein
VPPSVRLVPGLTLFAPLVLPVLACPESPVRVGIRDAVRSARSRSWSFLSHRVSTGHPPG